MHNALNTKKKDAYVCIDIKVSTSLPFGHFKTFSLQNSALDLPRGMSSSAPEFLQVKTYFYYTALGHH